MPHYFDAGFSVREPMWHGLGMVLEDYPRSRAEAMTIAGHNFEVASEPLYYIDSQREYVEIETHKAIMRTDTGAVLGVVTDGYQLIPNRVPWEILELMLGEIGEDKLKIETAGVLRKGTDTWILARLDEPDLVRGDFSPTYPYVLVTNTHDGTAACRAFRVSVRVVCWNTRQQAIGSAQAEFTFRHTKNVQTRIEQARNAILGLRTQHAEYIELMNELAGISVTDQQLERFVVEFIPSPPETLVSDRVAKNVAEARQAVRQILDSRTSEGIRNTGYGMLQAAIEYLDHIRRARSVETRFRRSLIRPEPLKERALKLVREVASAN